MSFYVCPTGKRTYYEERSANKAITNAAKRGELPQMRHYKCSVCDRWHLSRKDRMEARRERVG